MPIFPASRSLSRFASRALSVASRRLFWWRFHLSVISEHLLGPLDPALRELDQPVADFFDRRHLPAHSCRERVELPRRDAKSPDELRLSTLSDSPAEGPAKSDRSTLPYSAAYASSTAACSKLRASRV